MATVNSNNYKIAIVKELTYGAQVKNLTTGGGVFFHDKLERNRTPITVDLEKKTNTLAPAQDETIATAEMIASTMSGELTDGHEILLQAYFDDTASPYLHPAQLGTPHSYNVYMLYLNNAGACTHYDVLLGCAITNVQFSGESTGIIKYTAKIEPASMRQHVANASGDVLTLAAGLPVTGTPFLFCSMTVINAFSATSLLSFNLELAKTMVDNKHRYLNSFTKTNDRYIQAGGTCQWEEEWDGLTNVNDQEFVQYSQASQMRIVLANTAKTWTIDMNGVITDATRPDADKGLFVGNYTMKLTASSYFVDPPVTVTVASV